MKIKKLHNQGNHLILDGFSNQNLDDDEYIKTFLINLTKKIKMHAISKPLVINHKAKQESESGVTGIIILAESNITIHTYPNKKWFCLDVYSCNEFEIDETIDYLIKELKITKYKKRILKRGFY
jgi:S-adenosylmethionine decarboxylase